MSVSVQGLVLPTRFLFQQLLEQAQAKKRIQSPYESLRKEVLDFFHEAFKTFLMSPTRMTFHELKFFDRVVNIRRHLTAFPRGVIKAALEDPFVYLAVSILETNPKNWLLISSGVASLRTHEL